jgi:hypothetical protein
MPSKDYRAKLYVNGEEVQITSFSFDAPDGKIGVSLGFDTVDPDPDINRGDTIDFSILVGSQSADLLIDGISLGTNRSVGSSDTSAKPSDSFKFSAADSLGERRMSLTPRTPLILYDPDKTTLGDNETDTQINDEEGARIYAEAREVPSLDVTQLLNAAYVEGAGFASVVTNVFNYPVPRNDFPLTSSYHKSVKELFRSQYQPQIYEHDSNLFIVDPRGTLPTGFSTVARLYTLDDVIDVNPVKPDRQAVNALILTTHDTEAQEIPSVLPGGITERDFDETFTTGSTLDGNYQQTVIKHIIAQLHEDEADPLRITSEVEYKIQTTLTGQDEEGVLRQLMFDEKEDLFDFNFGRKIGYRRSVDAYVKRPGELANTENVLTEVCSIEWEATNTLGEFRKKVEKLNTEGLVMIEGEEPDITKTVLTDANRFGSIPDDATVERMPILTRTLYFRETGPDQIEVIAQGTDHLFGRPVIVRPQDHTGTIRIQLRNIGGAVKQTLLRDVDSEEDDGAREPITYDAGLHMPFVQALPLARRILEDAKNPPMTVKVILLKPDFGLRRGSLRRMQINRTGDVKLGVVTSYSIRGNPGPRGMIVLTMEFNMLVIGNA